MARNALGRGLGALIRDPEVHRRLVVFTKTAAVIVLGRHVNRMVEVLGS